MSSLEVICKRSVAAFLSPFTSLVLKYPLVNLFTASPNLYSFCCPVFAVESTPNLLKSDTKRSVFFLSLTSIFKILPMSFGV